MAVSAGVLAYDIADDRRRRRAHKLLEAYGVPLQESVFLLELPEPKWAELERKLLAIVNRREDDVRLWPLCALCVSRSRVWCGAPHETPSPVAVI